MYVNDETREDLEVSACYGCGRDTDLHDLWKGYCLACDGPKATPVPERISPRITWVG